MSQFVDLVRVRVVSGDGGNGTVAWRREKYEPLGGPAGGNGGRGGSVILQASSELNTLLDFHFRKEFKAQPGERGRPKKQAGKNAQDLIIKVPQGTLVRDAETGEVIADLTADGQTVMVAEGGRGGRGNADLTSMKNKAPHFCEPGEEGIARDLELELKLLADVGIVGLPNAGKSTLLSVMTSARPKIADYPFSTLQPNLGVVRKPNGDGFVMADVPGLVEGASQGVGLGHKFLRHLERTRLLIHMADMSDPELETNLATIAHELHNYSERLEKLPQIVALNKADVVDEEEANQIADRVWDKLAEIFPDTQRVIDVVPISCATTYGIAELQNQLLEELANRPLEQETHEVVEDLRAKVHPDEGFQVTRSKNRFYVTGNRLERMVAVTNMKSPEALHHLFNVMRAMGVIDALLEAGIEPGHDLIIGGAEFAFGEEML
jgi:GTP-binding protein